MDELPFVNTPLHIAASVGHIPFALEMMRLKPSFAKKLNTDGFSPIHLALQKGETQMVSRLLQVDGDLVRVKGCEGITPLHCAARTNDHIDVLAKFLLLCPDSIKDVTVQNETALHIAMKHDNLEAFKFLVRWLRENRIKNDEFWESKILNWEDNDGNTVLHLAVLNNQPKAVKKLLKSGVNINAKNLNDEIAWNLLMANKEIPPGGLWQEDYYPNNTTQPKIRDASGIPKHPGGDFPLEDVAGTPVVLLLLIPATYIYSILRLAFLALFENMGAASSFSDLFMGVAKSFADLFMGVAKSFAD
uniref:Uncharacterized protein n=1 Tax=Fagus sylvatica TaxID=28930 RepID=A0A2N9EXQ4_FAGSY